MAKGPGTLTMPSHREGFEWNWPGRGKSALEVEAGREALEGGRGKWDGGNEAPARPEGSGCLKMAGGKSGANRRRS